MRIAIFACLILAFICYTEANPVPNEGEPPAKKTSPWSWFDPKGAWDKIDFNSIKKHGKKLYKEIKDTAAQYPIKDTLNDAYQYGKTGTKKLIGKLNQIVNGNGR